ncbi:hypothetical protein TRFO_23839 [Tritrichomonas foetus]|uniref:Uncharacterized protein n=1 Tax=Tritrichomonas foetus TaxID=1144522 RepID=A0A1J4KDU9_9EUKA|nr:hypothetical protein TRFO_23839 [Tritrichomonas foetus]|eukprot:OHT07806.1 hypothetical protein TRFO_23839 [Tritrichomonas foetus]
MSEEKQFNWNDPQSNRISEIKKEAENLGVKLPNGAKKIEMLQMLISAKIAQNSATNSQLNMSAPTMMYNNFSMSAQNSPNIRATHIAPSSMTPQISRRKTKETVQQAAAAQAVPPPSQPVPPQLPPSSQPEAEPAQPVSEAQTHQPSPQQQQREESPKLPSRKSSPSQKVPLNQPNLEHHASTANSISLSSQSSRSYSPTPLPPTTSTLYKFYSILPYLVIILLIAALIHPPMFAPFFSIFFVIYTYLKYAIFTRH